MASQSQSNIGQKLALLQAEFKRTLPKKVADIESLWNSIIAGEESESAIDDFHRMVHTLAGSGGTFGAATVTTASREIIQAIKSIENKNDLSVDIKLIISELGLKLKIVADTWQPSKIPYFQPLEEEIRGQRRGNLIYLAEDDELLANELRIQLESDDFIVKHFSDLTSFTKAFADKVPSAIIMDVMFKEGSIAGTDAIANLKNENKVCPPIIFISSRTDIEARLAAAKAGAQRYFPKPLDAEKLSKTLDGLIARTETKPFRILFVDDDISLLKYYEAVLLGAGMEVKTITNPLNCLNVIEEFKPDVIVLDVYMPECSGPEVAQVIRQDDRWALTPIMFLSTETDLDIQLDSMNLGGEMFMVKPIAANHLISILNAKAKTSRWSNRLNHDLEKVIRENKYQIVTSNLHDTVSMADISGRIISVNDKFCEISGYARSELIGQNHRLLKSNHHPDSFYKDMWKTISSGEVWNGSICNITKTGEEYWVESTIVPFLDDKGKPYKYVSARTDVTLVVQSEERLERSQAFANIGTWDWNIETGSLFWSDRIWPLFGFDKEVTEATYDNFMAAMHPDDRKLVGDAITCCVEKNTEYNIEHRVIWPDGSIHWLHESGNVIRNNNNKPTHMLGVVQDITKRKVAEQAVVKSEKQLIEAQKLASIGNWQADMLTGELNWSDEIYRIFGYEAGSFQPSVEAFHAAIHPDDRLIVNESEKNAEKTGRHDVEHRILQPDGTVRYVHELAQAEVDKGGKLIRMSGTVQDITERVVAELQHREIEKRFAFAVEGAGDGIWDWNTQTNVMDFSKLYMEMLGYTENELPNTLDTWVNGVHPDDLDGVQNSLQEYLEGRSSVYTVELRLRCKDNSYKWILCRGTIVSRDIEGKPLRLIGIHSDITERKFTEQSLIQAREEAENANRAKSQFLSSMSHELRTPMNAIMGFGQLLEMDIEYPLNESQKENVTEILKASDHLLELINEVLDLAKIEAGRIDLSIEDVQVGSVVTESLQLILPLAERRGISVKLLRGNTKISISDLSKDQNIVRADHTRMKQVIINLLSNAVKYNSENGIITIKCDKPNNNNDLRVSITDTGKGLTKEQSKQLFIAFNRLGAENTDIEGTGVGLVITKNIVELMGGSIGVESEIGVGSTFWFELPGGLERFSNIDSNTSLTEVKVDLEEARTVLYIEDNPANLRLVTQLLSRLPNIHMWSAHEPKLGLELAAEHCPDLILLDINLPGMDGYEVLKILRRNEGTRDIPVIAISANAMPKDIEKGIEVGFVDYITKPININAFLMAIDDNLKS